MSLWTRREDLAALMSWEADEDAGLPATTGWAYLPPTFTPAAALVREGTPYVADAPETGYGRWAVTHQVDLVAPATGNEAGTRQLLAMLTQAIEVLEDQPDTTLEAGEPYTLRANGTEYLAITVTTTTTTTEL